MEPVAAVEQVRQWVTTLATLSRDLSDSERVDLVRALEELKGAAAATQARAASDFDRSQREQQEANGVPRARVGRGIGEQLALARRLSPFKGRQRLGVDKSLVQEMPHTLAALTEGRISEWRAELLVRETAYLAREHRLAIDEELSGPEGIETLEAMGDRQVVDAAKRIAYRLDPHAVTRRARRAEAQRSVTLRPAPDTMSYLTALLPVAHGVACMAALRQTADSARSNGDERSRGQVMADALVAALTGAAAETPASHPPTWAEADTDPATARSAGRAGGSIAGPPRLSGVALQLVMTDRALLAGDDEPAHLVGYGTVPAGWARDVVREARGDVWLRRLYTHPGTGELLAADARARLFTGPMRDLLVSRDQVCRTPWCDAPVRHADHVLRHSDGGKTSGRNGQGLCEQCSYAKEVLGWRARATSPPGDRHTVTVTTPTGHRYRSRAPAPPGSPLAPRAVSGAEYFFRSVTLAS